MSASTHASRGIFRLARRRALTVAALLLMASVPAAFLYRRLEAASNSAIDFGSANSTTYVNLGEPAALHLSTFTLEAWIRRDGAGTATSTGTGGLTAVPVVTKGRAESDASNLDMNYFMGIQGNVLAADFEEAPGICIGGPTPGQACNTTSQCGTGGTCSGIAGLNHPVQGVTALAIGTWYHVAATYDGATWRLYVNGVQDASLAVNRPPRSDSIQRAAIASALTSTGTAAGFFDGAIDEVRIWNVARTQAQIQSTMNVEVQSAPGLVGRWGLNEGAGTTVSDSSGSGITGTITGTNFTWTAGAPALVTAQPPNAPTLNSPANGATGVPIPATLNVGVSDPDSSSLSVSFFGRQASGSPPNFTIVALPDTQFYSQTYPATWTAQAQWILDNKAALNTVFMTQLGDCVQDGDSFQYEWDNANAAVSLLENPATTLLPYGLPYGISVGNHDQTPIGTPGTLADQGSTTVKYNQTFGVARFTGRSYYGGHYGTNNDNHYELFSASGIDFVHLSLEYDPGSTSTLRSDVLTWANGILAANGGRRAIVTSHYLLNPDATFSNQGQATYDALKGNPNLFLMLCGHVDQAARRADVFNGHTVYTLLSDFQTQPNGGNGWLRYLTFRPAENRIDVHTYSPTLNQFKTDASNEFSLDYALTSNPFALIATNNGVASGSSTSAVWSGLAQGTKYEWYATVSDGTSTTTGPVWSFTTQSTCSPRASNDTTCDGVDDDCDGLFDEDYVPVISSCGFGACAATGTTSCVNGAVQSNCVSGTPSLGNNLGFDGVDDNVDLGGAPAITNFGASSFTVEGWFKARVATAFAGIFRHGRQGTASQVTVQLPQTAPFDRITVSVEDTAGHQVDLTPVPIDLVGQWTHFAAVIDRTANQLRLYIDGSLVGTADGSAWGTNPISSTDHDVLGAARTSTGTLGNFFNGEIDEVRIWSGARTQQQIQQNMSREIASAPGLLARWGLNEGSGTTAADSAGGSTGTLNAGVAWLADSPISTEYLCNGIDDDCDGLTDEDYVSDASCGVGACRQDNTPSRCSGGVETACQPGAPLAANDASCDGIDDDCDGSIDEDFAPAQTQCGVGPCASTGTSTCVNGVLGSTCVPAAPPGNYALDVQGTREFVTFGPAPGLGLAAFTLETWFNRQGPGTTTSTGTNGVDAVPLVTKGRAEAEGSNVDMNYFLGIRGSDDVLAADFEDTAGGNNHPVAGVTPIAFNTWYHAAATYDGSTWRLYLNGNLERTLVVNATPRSDSIQHAAIATAMNSTGVAAGAFDGVVDEARIWSVALNATQIQAGMGQEITSTPNLVARWGFNEGRGSVLHDSTGHGNDGSILGGAFVSGTPFASGPAPLLDHALSYDGAANYVTFGPAPGLGSTVFTIEAWFNRTGAGVATNTGSGGLSALPLVTKGRAETEGSNVDMNYFLGIRASDNVLAADFEDTATGLNHPVAGVTPIANGTWYHAAATYDGTTWRLYLNGNLEAQAVVGATPRADSIQHAAVGTAMDSTGAAQGFFAGLIDEARVWHVARTQAEIQADLRREVAANATGLAARWGFNEGSGGTVQDPAGGFTGTIVGASWIDGYPFHAFLVVQDDTCDGVDNDCDGIVDNGFDTGATCSVGSGACASTGVKVCTADHTGTVCDATPVPDGTSCSDGNLCDGAETCQSGVCSSGTPVSCAPADQCHVAGVCDPATGLCTNPVKTDGTPCSDGDACTTGDTCQSGTCTAGMPVVCTASDQCHEAGICSPTTGQCSNPAKTDGASCDDANACTAGDACQSGVCTGGSTVVCAAPDQCHDAGVCNPSTGLCSNPAKADGTSCNDGNACTAGDTCQGGVCTGGAPLVCDDGNVCTDDSCAPASGCVHANNTASCDDGNVCNGSGVCQNGACSAGAPLNCDDGNPCTDDSCDPVAGCRHADNTVACSDGDACTVGDACSGGACVPGTATTCAPPDQCHDAGACVPSTGLCAYPAKANGTACSDGNACTTGDSCQAGACAPGAPVVCLPSDQCHETGACGPATGQCSNPAKADGSACDDGNACTAGDACIGGVCSSGAVPPEICNGLDDDCDGQIDEGNPGGGLACDTGKAGVCAAGVTACRNGAIACVQTTQPATSNVAVQFGSSMKYRANAGSSFGEDSILVQFNSPMKYLANGTDPGIGLAWIDPSFDDRPWTGGLYGVGYETAPPGAASLIKTAVPAGTLSVFTRATFSIADVSKVKTLFLGADYDDGYVAWINGVEVSRSSTMPAGAPAWNTSAASHESSNGTTPNYGTLLDLTATALPALHDGTNVLAIGVWNISATSTDLVLVPKLSIALDWTSPAYDDSSWGSGQYGVGYDTDPNVNALALIKTSVPSGSLSVFTRAHFNIPDAAALAAIHSVFLSADYDDGYIAWVNGTLVFGSPEMPYGPIGPGTSAALHESSNGATPSYGPLHDITARALPVLHVGDNLLAAGVWNNASTSTDLVLVPRLSLGEAEACNGLDDDCNGIVDDGFPDRDGDGQADCADPDDDNDGVPDVSDCDPDDPAASAPPLEEVKGFVWAKGPLLTNILTWVDEGGGVRYDLAGGLASQLRADHGTTNAACIQDNLSTAFFDDARPDPPPGQIYYYLARAESDACGTGTYGHASSGAEELAPAACGP